VTRLRLALVEDALTPGAPLRFPDGNAARILYLRRGGHAAVNGTPLAEDSAVVVQGGAATVTGEGELWTYALSPGDALATAEERPRLVLAALVPAPGPAALFRLDRVDFPPAGETPRHGHSGPGLRRLLSGRLLMEIGPRLHRADPGQAWFEPGDVPVVARPLAPGSAFLRAMVLDPALAGGRSSFVAATPEDAAKPRSVTYRLYAETVVVTPAAG
jgi:hypothetical protein